MKFRAAYIGETLLTGPEHSNLSDEALHEEARREMVRGGVTHDPITGEPIPDEDIEIGEWSDGNGND